VSMTYRHKTFNRIYKIEKKSRFDAADTRHTISNRHSTCYLQQCLTGQTEGQSY